MFYNFIICDGDSHYNEKYQEVIKKVAKDLKIEYNKYVFKRYNDEFREIINLKGRNKIYILNIINKYVDGLDMARLIRKSDLDSMIIFVSSYRDNLEFELMHGDYMFLKFIDKSNLAYEDILYKTIKSTIRKKIATSKVITIENDKVTYRFDLNSITHIVSEKRNIIINYNKRQAVFNLSLTKFFEELSSDFWYSKKSCIVNINRISQIEKEERIIYFDNGDYTNLVSKKHLTEILNLLK